MANPSGFYTCPNCGRLNAGAYTKCVCEQTHKEQTACRLDKSGGAHKSCGGIL